jgi:hypothetical protein
MAFAQGVNLNSEAEVKQGLTRTMCSILENYFLDKLRIQTQSQRRGSLSSATQSVTFTGSSVIESEDEIRALHALIRSYLSHISTTSSSSPSDSRTGGGVPEVNGPSGVSVIDATPGLTDNLPVGTDSVINILNRSHSSSETDARNGPGTTGGGGVSQAEGVRGSNDPRRQDEKKWQIFGKVPSFINIIVKDFDIEGKAPSPLTPSSFPTLESKEYFIKLTVRRKITNLIFILEFCFLD